MSPVIICLWILAAVCVATWVLSFLTKEYSWVDRIWSIVPVVYVWVYAISAGLLDGRLDVMAALVTLWGARLTFNFARKGGYAAGGEDYRWAFLRSRITGPRWVLFNILFIVIYQNVLIFLFTLPAWTAFMHPTPFTLLDVVAAIVFVAFLIGETVADQQQWDFHRWKASEVAAGRDPRPPFLQSGLFRYSRHPNFFFELGQWWVIFFFGTIAARSVLQWTVIGAVLLTVLFVGSTMFTESISRGRYPEYAGYQKTTSPIVPWLPRRRTTAPIAR
jgi:steroid 5-alpha reductase family enzyme